MNIIHKKTCVIVTCVIIVIISLALTLIINRLHKNQIIIVKSKSWFIDYEVNGDQVLIKCYITIKNTYKEEKKIRVFAKLPDEVVIGLLKNETVYVFDDNLVEKNYILPPQSINSFQVVFVGEYGGVNQKKDKYLPNLFIEEIE